MNRIIKTKVLAAVVLVSALSIACSRESIPSGEKKNHLIFNASFDNASTKTYLDGVQVKWEATDSVSLWYGTLNTAMTQANYFVGSIGTDSRQATLKGLALSSSDYLAVYPLSAARDCSKNGKLTVAFPMKQELRAGSFASKANVSVAYSNTTDLSFKNVGGLLAFKVSSTGGHTIKKIRLTGSTSMSGEVEISKAGLPSVDAVTQGINCVTLTANISQKGGSTSGQMESFISDAGSWTGTPENTYLEEGDYYFVSLPGSHTGFVLTFIDNFGKSATLKSNHTFTITRNSNTLIANVSLTNAQFRTDPQLYINEVDCTAKTIELYNPGTEVVDLSGWLLSKDEHSWAFPLGSSIPAGGYFVVNCNQSDCSTGPMFGLSGSKGFDLKLSNGGVVDHVDNLSSVTAIATGETYGRRTDGAGEWVVFSSGTIYNGTTCDGDNSKGTVKGEAPVVTSNVVLNEVDGNIKFIELFNRGTEPVSLDGWTLSKNDGDVWTGTASNVIAAGSYLVVYSSKCGSIPLGAPVFSGGISSKQTLKVTLKLANGSVTDTFTRGSAPWGETISTCSDSFGRTPDGTGSWNLITATPGTANGSSKGAIPQI